MRSQSRYWKLRCHDSITFRGDFDRQAVENEILQLADYCSKAPIPDESETSSSGSSSIAFCFAEAMA